jgi:signal transduction histidine kinase
VAGIAHEINNPLAFVSNNTVVLQRDLGAVRTLFGMYRSADALLAQHAPELHQQIRRFGEEIDLEYTLTNIDGLLTRSREGLQRIQQIVKGLRDFARLDESDLKETDLNAGIESTINILRGEVKKKHLTLTLDLAPLPEVTCYPARINQVVMNLVANAIYACAEAGEVTVRTRPEADGVTIEVIDNGSGIPAEVLTRIFDPFFTTKPVGQGTGLGLSISHQIVEDHGGRIEVQSAPGQGAHFTVHLPLRAEPRKK